MKRLVMYLAIITIAAWANFGVLISQTTPKDVHGNPHVWIILTFFILGFIGLTGIIAIILSLVGISRPNHKLPPLIVKDSLIQGVIVASWGTGILVLQFFQVASWLNLGLWTVIIVTVEWLIHEWRKKAQVTNHPRKIGSRHA